jgi:predicted TIM-barrel fold metal-dependent hydrolase
MDDTTPSGWTDFIDDAWLARTPEAAIDPDVPLVDPHHHIFTAWPFDYDRNALLKDLESGHKVVATVHTEAHGNYRTSGPEHLKTVGETEFLVAAAEAAAKEGHKTRICAGITGGGDLMLGTGKVTELLEAHIAAAKGRFCGIRANVFIGFDPATAGMFPAPGWEHLSEHKGFREGLTCMTRQGLNVDLVVLQTQMGEVARLARAFPDLVMVVNHTGTVADFSATPPSQATLLEAWRRGIDAIVPHPNVRLKLGGLGNPTMSHSLTSFQELKKRPKAPTSEELAAAYRPQVSYAIDKLGPDRCMFESNFPVDKWLTSYVVLWNAFKRLAAPYSADERNALLHGSAVRAYGLKL